MTVQELIEALKVLPPDAEVYMTEYQGDGADRYEERTPEPTMEDDGRVWLYGAMI